MTEKKGIVSFDSTPELEEYQTRLSEKIEKARGDKSSVADRWLGFAIQDKYYATPITLVQEIMMKPEKYINLGGWVSRSIKGAINFRDDLWAVYNGVVANEETPHVDGVSWEHHILILNTSIIDGNIGIAVDKVFGAVPIQASEKNLLEECSFGIIALQEYELASGEQITWHLWDPMLWLSEPAIKSVNGMSFTGEKNV